MKILVTGAKGFIGKNLVLALKNNNYTDIFEFDADSEIGMLKKYTTECDFVFHLAGINRPQNEDEFTKGNMDFTNFLTELLKNGSKCPVMFSSSIQAELDNPYGKSKLSAEKLIRNYSAETGSEVYIYRFPNVFGKWCRPNYNSAIATFCSNIANGLPIQVNDENKIMNLVYIDDVVNELIRALNGNGNKCGDFFTVPEMYTEKLGVIADTIRSFNECKSKLIVPNQSDMLTKKLYSTYLSYLPTDKFKYELDMHCDNRGSFTEFLRTDDRGQVSINISKPHIVKGNHWHNTKHEIFLVVKGDGVIRFRKPDSDNIIELFVNGDKLEPVIIPPGYTHNIENIGDTDMVTVMWANESFDPMKPDTYFLEV